MIRIGLGPREKQKEIDSYLDNNGIKKVFCFYFKAFPVKYKVDCDIEYIEYADIEMYKFFYRLLDNIDHSSLIIMDGCMRTQNRSELIYNCAHHYLNQTPHRLIFEHFPIIESKDDFMILLDFENKGKYKGKGFDYVYLQNEDIKIKPVKVKLETINVETTEKDRERYEKKKQQLFDGLGEKDPDTIPRNLQILAGDIKKKAIEPDKLYIARNKRFNMENVKSYQEITGKGDYIVIDMHYRRLNFNDFLKTTGMSRIKYLSTVLSIDSVIITEFMKWKARLEAIYAQASLYK
ncbi:hypothetical protein [Pelotomaculum propionicicum]|uniref:Uncharacterized protein n=1 Tax=Pelotomaculum propionicicum TaxID=258475 RepID=A0A4Y7RWQ9_9FIRM|nr:hypothetical protein [Pelotomaculum propionicicum]TEB13341.1 hypothetical protein Pmgp_00235 [Pelotomaculum propionicicum]